MYKQCLLLFGLQMRKNFGINEIIYGKDENKKTRQVLFLCLYVLVGIMLAGYTAGAALLLCYVGAARLVPVLAVVLPGVVVFLFSLIKVGPTLYERGDLEILGALPLRSSVLVAARFFTLYQGAFGLTVGTALPAGLIWLIMEGKGAEHLLLLLTGLPFMPLLPLTAACILGAVIMAVSAGMRHTRLFVQILTLSLTLLLVCGFLALSFGGGASAPGTLGILLETAVLWMERLYPPATLYVAGVAEGNPAAFLCFIGLSAGIFAAFVILVQRKFRKICGILQERHTAVRFQLGPQRSASLLSAMYRKELRRYFSSNVYVTNTLIAWLMLLAASAVCMFFGPERTMGLILQGMELTAREGALSGPERQVPCLLALFGVMGNTTAVSLSMEGKKLWIVQTLPMPMRVLGLAKVLVYLTMAVPSILLSCLLLALGGWETGIMTAAEPLCHVLFSAAFGLWMNRKLPNLGWNSEAEAVKRGGSLFLTMLAGMFTVLLSVAVSFLPDGVWLILGRIFLSAALLLASFLLFRDFVRGDLRGLTPDV